MYVVGVLLACGSLVQSSASINNQKLVRPASSHIDAHTHTRTHTRATRGTLHTHAHTSHHTPRRPLSISRRSPAASSARAASSETRRPGRGMCALIAYRNQVAADCSDCKEVRPTCDYTKTFALGRKEVLSDLRQPCLRTRYPLSRRRLRQAAPVSVCPTASTISPPLNRTARITTSMTSPASP